MSLEVKISKTFGSYTLDVDFSAEDEVFGLLGASGCGKSLTMRSIAGIETPDKGRIVVNDRVFFDSEKGINLKPQERKTALLFQNYMLFPNLTVEDNVAAGIPKGASKEEREAKEKRTYIGRGKAVVFENARPSVEQVAEMPIADDTNDLPF